MDKDTQNDTTPTGKKSKAPEPTCPLRHAVRLQQRFNDVDAMGHVNNSVYFQYLDLGKTHYFNDVVSRGIEVGRASVVIVHADCDFYSPAYMTEPLVVLTAVAYISERSITMEQRVVNVETGDVKCVGHSVLVGFDPVTSQSAPIDPAWAASIAEYEGRNLAKP